MADELNPQDSGSIDTTAALAEISQGLGFNADTNEDVGEGEGREAPQAKPAAPSSPSPAPAPVAAAPATPEASPAPAPQAGPTTPPKTWRPEASALFATLPATVQAEIHKREEDMFRGLEGYRSAATFGQGMHKAMEHYLPILQQYKIDPAQQVAGLMRSHHTLAMGTPEQKVGLMLQLVRDYGVDLQQVLSAADPANAPYIDPAVQNLTRTVSTLQSQLAKQNDERRAELQSKLSAQIDSFAKDATNTHFEAVATDMALLLEKGVCTTLEQAYEKAVWANPVTRALEAEKLATEKAEAARKAAAEKASAARKATGANVRSIAKSGSATAPVGTIDDTLRETLASIKARG